jgi:hypothetical protein
MWPIHLRQADIERRLSNLARASGAERELEPVTPVDRQQLLVGHGAECMVGQEGRAGPGATGTAISSMGLDPRNEPFHSIDRETPAPFSPQRHEIGRQLGRPNSANVAREDRSAPMRKAGPDRARL